MAVPMIFVVLLVGVWISDNVALYLAELGFTYWHLLTVGFLALLSIVMFSTVLAYRIYTYMYIFLWASGIYIIDVASIWIIPSLTQWLDSNQIP
jgi:hypothetical protein